MERRILVYGVTGSGKSSLAARISHATGIAWTSVDELTWEPGWVPVPEEEQRRRISDICAREEWLLDTAYGAWLDVPLADAELVVALDYPRWLSLARLVRRTLARVADQRPICNGNTESWRQVLSRDSIIAWHFRSFRRNRARMRSWAARRVSTGSTVGSTGSPRVVLLRSPREAERWLASLTGPAT